MDEPKDLHELREDVAARQRATVWPDTVGNGRSIDAFLWDGDPHAKPVQRAGLVVFGLAFLLFSVSIVFGHDRSKGSIFDLIYGMAALLISLRLFRNALLRAKPDSGQKTD